MGWPDRDWARAHGDGRKANGRRVRRFVWGAVGVAVIAVFGMAYAIRPPRAQTVHPLTEHSVAGPAVIYGIPGSSSAADAPGGRNTVCFEITHAPGSTQLECLAWRINLTHAAVVTPRPYDGPCAYAVVDQKRGAWTCRNVR